MKVSNNEFATQQVRQFGRIMENIQSKQEQISSGQKINRPSDAPVDATRLVIADQFKDRVSQYIENTKTAEGRLTSYDLAYKGAANIVTRIKELAIQAANDSNGNSARASIAIEMKGLRDNLFSITNTRNENGQYIFAGYNSDSPAFVSEKKEPNLKAYTYTGNVRSATVAATTSAVNSTTILEDIVINGRGSPKTIEVAAAGSAQSVAASINAEAKHTGVTATAKTYAKLATSDTGLTANTLTINGITTAGFNISTTSVSDAVTKINAITSSTGVTASASTDNSYVVLYHSTGEDITIENAGSDTDLSVWAVDHDGVIDTTQINLGAAGGNDSSRIVGTIKTTSPQPFSIEQLGSPTTGYFSSGSSGLSILGEADYSALSTIKYAGSPGRREVQISESLTMAVQDDGFSSFMGVIQDDGTKDSVFDLIDKAIIAVETKKHPTRGFTISGTPKAATIAATSTPVNTVTGAEDIVLVTNTNTTTTIDVAANDSAQKVAAKVNAVTGRTGVTAEAKTYAKLLTNGGNDAYSLKINGVSTGTFNISKTFVGDAVIKLNAIKASTGVSATAVEGGTAILLYSVSGADIAFENESTQTELDVFAVDYDGKTVVGAKQDLAAAGGNDAVSVSGNIELGATNTFSLTQNGTDSLGFFVDGSSELSTVAAKITQAIPGLTSSLEHLFEKQASSGARINTITSQTEILENRMLVLERDISDLRDADLAELVLELQNHLTTLEAAQLAYSKISQLNLFDYIR